jgi:hypothetical protein
MYRDMNNTAESQAFITNLQALKRVAKPEELARSVLYLAFDDSSFVTGTASLIDGRASISRTRFAGRQRPMFMRRGGCRKPVARTCMRRQAARCVGRAPRIDALAPSY